MHAIVEEDGNVQEVVRKVGENLSLVVFSVNMKAREVT
jgi:hypothetical protein